MRFHHSHFTLPPLLYTATAIANAIVIIIATQPIDIDETKARRWFVVAVNCDESQEKAVSVPVQLDYKITTSKSIACERLRENGSAGLTVAVVFLTLLVIALGGTTFCFYKKAQLVPSAPSSGDTHYDQL